MYRVPLTLHPYKLCVPYCCRLAEESEAKALAAKEGASAAVKGARQAGARLRGKENEVSITDLHAVAEARLMGWSAWVTSRDSMDRSLQGDGGDKVESPLSGSPNATVAWVTSPKSIKTVS